MTANEVADEGVPSSVSAESETANLERLRARLTSARRDDAPVRDFALGRTTPHPAALYGAKLALEHNVQHATMHSAGIWLTEERRALATLGRLVAGRRECETPGIPTSGGAEAILIALIHALDGRLPDYRGRGISGAKPRIYLSQEGHGAVAKAGRILGLGDDAIVRVRLREDGAIDPNALRDCIGKDLAAGLLPLAIVATVGTTVAGAIDDLDDLSRIARAQKLWLHADAAWGGILPFGPDGDRWRRRFAACDSLSVDPHKTYHCPLGLGVLYIHRLGPSERSEGDGRAHTPRSGPSERSEGDGRAHTRFPHSEGRAPLHVGANYVPKEIDPPWAQGISWSRGAVTMPLIALLAALGEDGFVAHIGRAFARAERLRAHLQSAGSKIVASVTDLPIVTILERDGHRGEIAKLVETLAVCNYKTSPVRFTSGKLGLRIGLFDGAIEDADIDQLGDAIHAFYSNASTNAG